MVMSDFISFNGEFPEYSDVQPLYTAQPAGHIASYTRVPVLANLDLDTTVYAKKKKKRRKFCLRDAYHIMRKTSQRSTKCGVKKCYMCKQKYTLKS